MVANLRERFLSKHTLELFTDAVLAIILTLMVLDLHEPQIGGWHGVVHLLPSAAPYAVAFALICCAWVGHHEMLLHVEHINRKMLLANFGFLFLESLVPLLLRMVVDHPHDSAVMVAFIMDIFAAMWCLTFFRLAARRDHATDPDFAEWTRKRNRGALIGSLLTAFEIGVAFVSPMLVMPFLAVTAIFMLSTMGEERSSSRRPQPTTDDRAVADALQ